MRQVSKVPIIFLTASDEEVSIIMGLDIGGDDYITKPFKLSVLVSRINALLRRTKDFGAADTEITSNGITVFLLQGQAHKGNAVLDLTAVEYKLLCLFMQNPGIIFTKEKILDKLWDGNYVDDNTLAVYIRRLRTKIEVDPGNPQMLVTVRGLAINGTSKAGAVKHEHFHKQRYKKAVYPAIVRVRIIYHFIAVIFVAFVWRAQYGNAAPYVVSIRRSFYRLLSIFPSAAKND